ncbi:hypothetical protein BU17DRAFT_72797 [Hysterangium stoloniferum]|nr:hypothetical protein BU17DRAFT_72797 [Hysterangium stoloniferum]
MALVLKASPFTSNGNEQVHWNINRDRIKLMMLAGIMRGMQFDSRCMASLDILCKYGINVRDQQATQARAIQRSKTQASVLESSTGKGKDLLQYTQAIQYKMKTIGERQTIGRSQAEAKGKKNR